MNNPETPGVFLREASGLVKSADTPDVFIYNVGLISVGIGVAYTHLIGPANYPGGNVAIASLVATLVMVLVGWAFWHWTVIFPRSGGVYVFLTRGLNGSVGYALSFVDAICWLFYNAVGSVLLSSVGLAPLFFSLWLITGDTRFRDVAQLLDSRVGQFVAGTVLILVSGLILASGMRRYFLVQRVVFLIALAGTVAMLITLATSTPEAFKENFNRLVGPQVGLNYQEIIDKAKQLGWRNPGFGWDATLSLSVWPFLPLIGGAFSIAIGGEIRNVPKAQAFGIIGSIVACGICFALIGRLSDSVFGYEFQAAVAYTSQKATGVGLPVTPYFPVLLAILTASPLWTAIFCLTFIAWIYFWIPGMLAYAERTLLAWSFDRLAPAPVGYVSERYHTPVVAILVTVLISILFLALYVFSTLFATLVFILAAAITWAVVCLVGVIFPFRAKSIYDVSPVSQLKILGLPSMAVSNLLAALALGFMAYLLIRDPLAAGSGPRSLGTVAVTFALGLLLYHGTRIHRARKGIDVTRAFKEIPIE